ncbi:MAG: ABC transporter permease subunit [bacterium]
MLKILLEKELREIIYSTKFSITFGAAAVLVLLSFYAGIRNYQESMREYEAAKTANATNISALTDWRQVQHKVFRKPQPLQVLVSGVSNDIGRTTEVRQTGELSLINSRFSADPLYAVFRFLDLNFVFIIVLSLFAILFGYDAINGEKESGTLKLVFANRVSRAEFILAKLLGSLLALGLPLIIPMLIGSLMLLGFGIPLSGAEWARLTLIIIGGLLCFGVFVTLSIMLSAMVTRSSVSFLLSLVVWIFSVLIVPKGSVLFAAQIASVPNLDTMEIQKRKYNTDQMQTRIKGMQQWFSTHTNFADTGFSTALSAFQDSLSKALEKDREKFYSRLNEEWRNKKDWQEQWAFGLSRVSPTAIYQIAAMNLANTDVPMKERYLKDLDRYQDAYAEFIRKKTGGGGEFMRIVMRSSSSSAGSEEEKPKQLNPVDLPEFVEQERTFGEVFSASFFDLGLLTLLNVLFFSGAFVAFLKFDLR